MCGIFGAFGPKALSPELPAGASALAHRGPDGCGEWTDPTAGVYLAHTRLAIIDLTAASDQPFESERGILVFNGEIYNYKEIRDELRRLGQVFHTVGDTEVVIRALEYWGAPGLHRLRGMFAFAYWDKQNREMLLVRDRFGIKPLFILSKGQTTVFASEIEALRRLGWSQPRADVRAAYHLLNYLPAPHTFYAQIRKVLPGELLRISARGVRSETWYRLEPRHHGSIDDLLRRSVQEHTRCDVDYGVFLSGGLDSAIVAALAADATGKPPSSFSIGFKSYPAFDESALASRSAAFMGTAHCEHDVSPSEFVAAAEACLDKIALGEPFADASFVPTWLVSQGARRTMKVALSGDGADEVFGGYRKYAGIPAARMFRKLPALATRRIAWALSALPEARDAKLLDVFRRMKKFVDGAVRSEVDRQLAWLYVFRPEELPRLGIFGAPIVDDVRGSVSSAFDEAAQLDEVNRALYVDATMFLPADMLHKVDLASMNHGLEVRVPFLDHELVETAFTLPGTAKTGIRGGKRCLRRLFRARVAPEVLKGPKRGFESPMSSVFRGVWRGIASSFGGTLADFGVDRSYIRELEDAHARMRADNSIRLWNLLVLARWARAN